MSDGSRVMRPSYEQVVEGARETSSKLDHTLRAYANLERSNAELRRENAALRAELESYERAARRERAADRASDRY